MRKFGRTESGIKHCGKVEGSPELQRKYVLTYIFEITESWDTGNLYTGSLRYKGVTKMGRWYLIGRNRHTAIEQPIYYK